VLAHVVETARTYQALSDVIADKDTLQLCSDVDVPTLMNAVVADETHADQTNNVKTLQEASSVVATVDSAWNHKEVDAVMSMNAPWEEEVVLSDAQTHTVDSNALAQWDSSDWDLDIASEVVQVDSDNKFLATEAVSEAASAVDTEVVTSNPHKLDGPSLKPDVSAACQVEIPREASDQLMNQKVDLLKLTTTEEELKLTLRIQSKLSSTLLMENHTEPSSHSDHL